MTAKKAHPACLQCGCNLIRLKWNDKCDVLVCDNVLCSKYRQLAGTVKVGGEVNKDSEIDCKLAEIQP